MTLKLPALLVVVPALALAACASSGGVASRQAVPAAQASAFVPDSAYIARVESRAMARGVQVNWVHPPTLRRADLASD